METPATPAEVAEEQSKHGDEVKPMPKITRLGIEYDGRHGRTIEIGTRDAEFWQNFNEATEGKD